MTLLHSTAKKLIVVLGPTAAGKTACAISLAKHLGTEIVSADSRQCYKEMSIGTAKPTEEECGEVKHHLVDFLSIEDTYNVADFEVDALKVLGGLWQKHDCAILTGGTGLYIQALCEGLPTMPAVPLAIRKEVEKQYATEGLTNLLKELQEKDPDYYHIVDRQNPHRIIRAISICRLGRENFSFWRRQPKKKRDFAICKIGLNPPRKWLYERINERVDKMVGAGLLEEVRRLYPYRHQTALQTIGYQEIFPYIAGRDTKEGAIERLKRNTRRYAKRQMTWFRRDPSIVWFAPEELVAMREYVDCFVKRG